MAGKQNEKAVQAEKLYRSGVALAEIARKLEVPPGTVRRWKSTYQWDSPESVRNKPSVRNEKANARKEKEKIENKLIASVEANEELTEKQKLFCVFYVQTFNATQSYLRAYGGEYTTAKTNGPAMLAKTGIREEIQRLKEIKRESLFLGMEDLAEKQMRVAFADLSDYVEWGQEEVDVMGAFGPVSVTDPDTGEKGTLKKIVNTVRFKESSQVDASLLQEVKVGRDGASVKLMDKEKAIAWLTEYLKAQGGDDGGVQIIDDI